MQSDFVVLLVVWCYHAGLALHALGVLSHAILEDMDGISAQPIAVGDRRRLLWCVQYMCSGAVVASLHVLW